VARYADKPQAFLGTSFVTIFTLACVFCAGCASVPPPFFLSRSPADRAIEEDDIRESVFRYRIEGVKRNGPFFLSINGKDPSETFMARFGTSNKIVKKGSGSYFKKDPFPGWLRDRSTDQEGMSFSVGSISWLSSDRVEVRGRMYCGGLCADAGIYRLRKMKGRWVVDQYEVQMVS
jgi:hypothetical protein